VGARHCAAEGGSIQLIINSGVNLIISIKGLPVKGVLDGEPQGGLANLRYRQAKKVTGG